MRDVDFLIAAADLLWITNAVSNPTPNLFEYLKGIKRSHPVYAGCRFSNCSRGPTLDHERSE